LCGGGGVDLGCFGGGAVFGFGGAVIVLLVGWLGGFVTLLPFDTFWVCGLFALGGVKGRNPALGVDFTGVDGPRASWGDMVGA
jgi:hypothetical protein